MTDIPPIDAQVPLTPSRVARTGDEPERSRASSAVVDQVEISDLAQLLGSLDPSTDIRAEKVAAVRDAIRSGTYETPEKIEATVNRLLDVLRNP